MLDGDVCKKKFDSHNFCFVFLFSITILAHTSILPVSQLQTQKLMKS